jgi:hypothetical protein
VKGLFVSAALCIAVACSNSTGLPVERLAVQVAPPVLLLTNQSPAPIYFLAMNRASLAAANWAFCSDPTRCIALNPGVSTALPYAQIGGYTQGAREAVVYWWHLIRATGTGFRPDSIRAVVAALW